MINSTLEIVYQNYDDYNFSDDIVFPAIQTKNGKSSLCGVPGVCNQFTAEKCSNISLHDCTECNTAASGMFVFIATLLGLAIVLGNSLIIAAYIKLNQKCKTKKVDLLKVSLAVADTIAGILIFLVTFPNFAWTMNSTLEQLLKKVESSRNSFVAIAGGFFYLLGYTASLYHLIVMGIIRLYAIKRPHKYCQMSKRNFYVALACAWILASVVASYPAWFPQFFSYQYNAVTFLYLPSLSDTTSYEDILILPATLTLFLGLLLPYLIMTILSISTAIVVRNQLQASSNRLQLASSNRKRFSKQEVSAFKNVVLMQFGFTITLIPIGVVAALLYSGSLTCKTLSTPMIICFNLSVSNSLVNVLVYSIREKKFRSTFRSIFQNCCRCCNNLGKIHCINSNTLLTSLSTAKSAEMNL